MTAWRTATTGRTRQAAHHAEVSDYVVFAIRTLAPEAIHNFTVVLSHLLRSIVPPIFRALSFVHGPPAGAKLMSAHGASSVEIGSCSLYLKGSLNEDEGTSVSKIYLHSCTSRSFLTRVVLGEMRMTVIHSVSVMEFKSDIEQ